MFNGSLEAKMSNARSRLNDFNFPITVVLFLNIINILKPVNATDSSIASPTI